MDKVQPARILIVEDEASTANYIREVLESLGYTIAAVTSSGTQAVEKSQETDPDLVLMDILLEGDLDGVGAAEQIRKRFSIPVVYLTAYSDESTLHRAKITEPYGFVVKPFEEGQLQAAIELALYKHEAEERFREEIKRPTETLKSIVDAVMTTDEKGFVSFMNPAAEALTAWKAEEACGRAWAEVFNITKESAASLIDSSIAAGLRDHAALRSKAGEKIPVDYAAGLLKDQKGNAAGFVFVFRDVTGRTNLEKSLAESRRKYKDLVNSVEGVVWEADRNHHFSFVSKQALRLLGYPIERWHGEPTFWKDHIHQDDRQWAVGFSEKAVSDKRDYEIEYRMVTADGRMIWIRDLLNVIVESNRPVKLRGVMLDITEQKRMEAAIRQAHDELEQRVHERTAELSKAISSLQNEVAERKKAEEALRESEQKYRTLIEGMGEGLLNEDNNGRILFVNNRFCEMVGYSRDELIGKVAMNLLLRGEDREFMRQKNRLRSQGVSDQYEIQIRTKSGNLIWVQVSGAPVVGPKGIVGSMGILTDVTERKGAEEALRESQERYELAVLGANDGLWDWNLKANQIYFSPRWKSMLDFQDNEIGNSPDEWFRRVHTSDLERLKAEITAHLSGESPQFQDEHRMLHKDGSHHWMLARGVAVRDKLGAYRMAGSLTDVTERKRAEEQLLHDAFHDALTQLSNRALFMDRLAGAVARTASRAKRGGQYLFAVLFLDLDRFKVVNDSLGHMIGDQLLIGIARRLEKCLRPGDTIARLGGDEFAILIEDISDITDATRVAERVQMDLKVPFSLDGHEVFTTASMGIALSSAGYERGEDLLRDADTAMYRAKAGGKARYEVFDKSMHGTAVALLQLETDLRRAIERNEFLVHYQPIVSLKSRKIIGFEALVRWQHPERGLLAPEELIPVAEETGLIIPIGQWVLHEACRQMKEWQEEFDVDALWTVSVNLSGRQFSQPDLTLQIAEALKQTELPAQRLKLEITESVIMENAEYAASMLHQLRNLNVRLLIDDFGTGYSSLSYLHRFPINTLKIDRSFVTRIGVEGENWEIVRTIVTLANNLGMDVVAEGVETEEQYQQLLSIGCQHGQGYFFHRPLDSSATRALIAESQ